MEKSEKTKATTKKDAFASVAVWQFLAFIMLLCFVWVNEFLGVRGTPDEVKLTKIVQVQKWVMEQYNVHGRLTAISDEELEQQVRKHLPELCAKHLGGK